MNVSMVRVTRIRVEIILAKQDVSVWITCNRCLTVLYTAVSVQPASVAVSNARSSSSSLDVSVRYAANACSSCGRRLTKSESVLV